jgi:hypothetical protein
MNKLVEVLGMILCVLGVMVIAGSAGDCDGKCMEAANSLVDMWIAVGAGAASVLLGAMMVWLGRGKV